MWRQNINSGNTGILINLTIFFFFYFSALWKREGSLGKTRFESAGWYPNFSVICYCCVRRTRKQIKVCSDGMKTFLLILLKDGFFSRFFSFRCRNNVLHWWKKLILGVCVLQQWKGWKKATILTVTKVTKQPNCDFYFLIEFGKIFFSNFFNYTSINESSTAAKQNHSNTRIPNFGYCYRFHTIHF